MIFDLHLALLLAALAFLTVALVLNLLLHRKVQKMAEWMRQLRRGEEAVDPGLPTRGPLAPLAEEAATLARNLSHAQEMAEQEARLRRLADSLWTRERLREHVKAKLGGRPLVVVSNREPYRHVRRDGKIECQMPASGLITGVEPILRACGGTWVAQGDGSADKETSDKRGRIAVPPETPQYALRRLWLTPEEEKGFYLGFANEGLWPLCHIAHTRPVFRAWDWAQYQEVNRKFAEAVFEEIAGLAEPYILVQDYHFTLLPRLLKSRRPDARVGLFWHIPWPNPEAFGICPWQKDILDGMLGADLLGFHTQFHCNNFLDTADRALECRIDRERFAVTRKEHATLVKPFPISVAFEEPGAPPDPKRRREEREKLLKRHGLSVDRLAVGVDRIDYTKGIVERFKGVERLLEKYPSYRGRFTLLQIGAPSRTDIQTYRRLAEEIEAEAKRINARFKERNPPIVLIPRHHSHEEILPYYRAADVCLVTPLHDGMNLVAKEFAAARDDERGALVLSKFAGASRELLDAILVNPYDADQVAESIHSGLEMDEAEQAVRMARLRKGIRENNIYRWAADFIAELSAVRVSPGEEG